MATQQVVLLNQSSTNLAFTDLTKVAQALQTQIDRDFVPVWGMPAVITALHPQDPVPTGSWPIRIVDEPAGGLGVHLDQNGKPYAEVAATDDWSVTASHELLEMLVDPLGHKFIRAPDIDPSSDGHLVSYLVEVGDPCEIYSYTIGAVAVSDFVTRDYYNPNAAAGTRVDFLGRLSKPFDVPEGCYLSWIDPQDQRWHQKTPEGVFTRAQATVDPKRNPREDRDLKLPEFEGHNRHDLAWIRQTFLARKK